MSGYIPNLPTANQTIAQTQAPINTNFTVINTAFSVDHTPMTSGTNQGDHLKVSLVTGSDPAAIAAGPIVYSKAILGKNEIFFRQATGDGSAIVQLTDMQNAVTSAVSGSSFLPGGTIIKWGQVTTNGAGTATIAWGFPNTFYSAQLTRVKSLSPNNRSFVWFSAAPTLVSGSIFLADNNGTGFSDVVCWMAIGN